MMVDIIPLFLLVAFAVRGHSLPYYDETDDSLILEQMSAYDKLVSDFLGNSILSGIDSSKFCDDPYAAFCDSKARNHTRPVHIKKAYRNIRNYMINILKQPIVMNEVTSFSVEKTLFRKCMNLGLKNDTANLLATGRFVTDLFQNVLNSRDVSWQNVDKELNLQGFDFTFFDIGVERDPLNARLNIIVIKPPKLSRINNLIEWAKMVFDPDNRPDRTQILWKFFNTIDKQVPVKRLFSRWQEILSQSLKQHKQTRTSLSKWNEVYSNRTAGKPEHTKIDWQKVIKETFDTFNINVKGSENIIVRNKDYFYALIDFLGSNTNDVIVLAMKAKIILENIRQIDYNYADLIWHRKKTLFCYDNTNLYGASFRLLRDLKVDDSNDEEHYDILNEMILSIADILIFNIEDSNNLTPKEQRYLKAQVKLMTSHVVKYKNVREIVDDYYEDYETDVSYFVSILKYRKMLKDKELRTLTVRSEHLTESEPFSVIDLAKPRNRFILHVFASSLLLSKQPVPFELQREVHYGIYGASIASFLYGLLNEDRFDNEVDLTGTRVDWYDHPIYPYNSLQCFVGKDVRSYGWRLASEAVSQISGAHIAYNAMLEDYEESELIRPKEFSVMNSNSELQAINADKLFFMSYGKYQCHLGQKLFRTIMLNLYEYNAAFQCGLLHEEFKLKCPLDFFQIQGKHRFYNKPF